MAAAVNVRESRSLTVTRAGVQLACNFAREERAVPVAGGEIVLATHDGTRLDGGAVVLPPLAGAVVR